MKPMVFEGGNGAHIDWSYARLVGARLIDMDLRSALLMGADLSDADLSGADLRGANMRNARFYRTNFTSARLTYACLEGAYFHECLFTDADVRHVHLARSSWSGCDFTHTLLNQWPKIQDSPAVYPSFEVIQGWLYRVYHWAPLNLHSSPRPPLICLHGMTGHALDFEEIACAMDRPVYSVELIGHGESGAQPLGQYESMNAPKQPLTFSRAIDHLIQLSLRLIPKGQFSLLGYSMGGRLALSLANDDRLRPRLEALYLIGASAGLIDEAQRDQRRLDDQRWIDLLMTRGVSAFLSQWNTQPLLAHLGEVRPKLSAFLNQRRRLHDPYGLSRALEIYGLGAMPPLHLKLSDLNIPTVWFYGALDSKFGQLAHELAQPMLQGRSIEIGGCGHAPHLEDSALFLSALQLEMERIEEA